MTTFIRKDINTIKSMLYSRERSFNNFANITEEDEKRIKELVQRKIDHIELPIGSVMNAGSIYYIQGLNYVTSPNVHLYLKNFDERLYFLINMCDPELKAYQTYIQSPLITNKELKNITDMKEFEPAFIQRKNQLLALENKIREAIGFYDPKLVSYEEKYHRAFIKDKEFAEGVKMTQLPTVLNYYSLIKDFSRITPERYLELQQKAQEYISSLKHPADANSLAYSILKQNNLLHLKNIEEGLTLMILVIDPELDMLRIQEEESRLDRIIEEAKNRFGFYNPNLAKIERLYHKQFTPDKKVSIWDL